MYGMAECIFVLLFLMRYERFGILIPPRISGGGLGFQSEEDRRNLIRNYDDESRYRGMFSIIRNTGRP